MDMELCSVFLFERQNHKLLELGVLFHMVLISIVNNLFDFILHGLKASHHGLSNVSYLLCITEGFSRVLNTIITSASLSL